MLIYPEGEECLGSLHSPAHILGGSIVCRYCGYNYYAEIPISGESRYDHASRWLNPHMDNKHVTIQIGHSAYMEAVLPPNPYPYWELPLWGEHSR